MKLSVNLLLVITSSFLFLIPKNMKKVITLHAASHTSARHSIGPKTPLLHARFAGKKCVRLKLLQEQF
jgi:hypothetical protein